MPPALQNMQGIPGYNDELQKWQNSQNQDPALQKAEIQKNVDALKNAKWETAVPAVAVKTDSQGVPYHDYKGIVDPVAAKKAWETDQKENAH